MRLNFFINIVIHIINNSHSIINNLYILSIVVIAV